MIGIVFPSWRIPEHRLRDHFSLNAKWYNSTDVRVFAVTDREYEIPEYAECVIFPEDRLPVKRGKRRFSTTRCRNAGIQAARQAGCDRILCTEVDIAFEQEAWDAACSVSDQAAVPYCRMSLSSKWDNREASWVCAPKATGTVTMTAANWGTVRYSEKQWGYGCDDGLILTRIVAQRIRVNRAGYIYHMAHIDGTPQTEFNKENPRTDHWNRKSGFNPDNFRRNGRIK